MNRFNLLSLEPSLLYSEQEIKDAFLAQEKHHDAILIDAREHLLTPAGVLKEWMTAFDMKKHHHAQIDSSLMSLFSEIADITNQVNELSHRKTSTQSPLILAMIDKALFEKKSSLDTLAKQIKDLEQASLSQFSILEESKDPDVANRLLGSLQFLTKWRNDLNHTYSKLF